jgi:type IV secretory pathway TraG/TraD family ATPase VirD4
VIDFVGDHYNDRWMWALLASFVTVVLVILHHDCIAILFAALVVTVATVFRCLVPARKMPRDRTRTLNRRLHLHLMPGRGFLTLAGHRQAFGKRAMVKRSERIRPSMTRTQRKDNLDAHSIVAGQIHLGRDARIPCDEHVVVLAEPRQGKTGWLARVILKYPGAVFTTTTREDLFANTSGIRSQLGPVAVFNPQRIGHVPSTFRWNPVRGCRDEAVAIRRATAFSEACSGKGTEDQSFWENTATGVLRALLCAADLVGADLRLVEAWAFGNALPACQVLEQAGKAGLAIPLMEFVSSPAAKTTSTIKMVLEESFAFMGDPALAECVLPADDGLDFTEFIRDRGTIYMIAEAQGKSAPVAGLFACIATEFRYAAMQLGSKMPGGRMDPPMLMALDEVAAICPIPVPTFLQDSGGKGIQIITVAHGIAQLEGRWQENGRKVIMDTSNLLILPGVKDTELLRIASNLAGDVLLKDRTEGRFHQHPVITEAMIRALPAWRALLIRGGRRPAILKLGMSWQHPEYKRAARAGTAVARVTAPASRPMLEVQTEWGHLLGGSSQALTQASSSEPEAASLHDPEVVSQPAGTSRVITPPARRVRRAWDAKGGDDD